ncbi:Stp1/IreP family PP2C-type Ser/Thr phosphatase [Pediococcus claussenii]|uniref:protein-serine/threonine phosphatase n=1 Tax=Pediococcus claussenii (strain ATCC BAA-344 / DSM 14800 / JCM 18046 / KCTC 3811 / LMG 21948 / P06) TaxID=701521 RepID=G8PDI2_PEDCP|nr:Stp1/IreP family PP2C-type Ser/Thr phosphatase [Pediococcus claussenii]AEV95317.1 serine/threonine phosphatase stp [Pediococcus claussenii ATCC BAA-344]ANZ68850.1 protein phosphatase [Pediococcus claussenii]ANZ70666.1 protein phosphatase [Pediococcus claussenii]KRN19501.1 stp protein [Pediococcus claussenii]
MNYAYLSDRGSKRANNQDFVGIFKNKKGAVLSIVADGVGGHRGGDVASEMAVSHIGVLFEESTVSSTKNGVNWLRRQISAENTKILAAAKQFQDLNGMGTTIVVALFVDHQVIITNLGDSRCYLYSADGNLQQLSTDHSLVNELVEKGEITNEEAKFHPQKNYITRSLGVDDNVQIDTKELVIHVDDQYLLCTDGLTNQVSNDAISIILQSTVSLEEKCNQLIEMANNAGGPDNITALIVKIDQEESK